MASSVAPDAQWKPSSPDELLCPITMKVMCNPVILSSGHAVELDALLAFWRTCPFAIVNPVTHEKLAGLEDVALVPALQVRSAVDAYLSTLPPGTAPDGWENANIGHRSTREELRVLSCRVHQVSTCATTVRLGGSLPRAANEQARACLGVYERDAKLTNDKPSYTKRGGSHALWFSSVKPDGTRNCFWHAAVVHGVAARGDDGWFRTDVCFTERAFRLMMSRHPPTSVSRRAFRLSRLHQHQSGAT